MIPEDTNDPEASWPETERRESSSAERAAFDRAVEKSAEIAAQSIAKLHRGRVLRQAAAITLICSLAIMLPISLALHANAVEDARANAHYDCRLFARATGILSEFVTSESALRSAQTKTGLTKQIVQGFAKIIPIKTLRAASQANAHLLAEAEARWARNAQQLLGLSAYGCYALR